MAGCTKNSWGCISGLSCSLHLPWKSFSPIDPDVSDLKYSSDYKKHWPDSRLLYSQVIEGYLRPMWRYPCYITLLHSCYWGIMLGRDDVFPPRNLIGITLENVALRMEIFHSSCYKKLLSSEVALRACSHDVFFHCGIHGRKPRHALRFMPQILSL